MAKTGMDDAPATTSFEVRASLVQALHLDLVGPGLGSRTR